MATTSDVRDIMDLGQTGPRLPAPKKKKKRVEPQVRLSGVSREVAALMGDSVPPVVILEQKAYKQKPSIAQKLFKPRHWDERSFKNGARTDGLVLKHWKRAMPSATRPSQAVTTPTDVEMRDASKDTEQATDLRFEPEFPAEKWNIPYEPITYTDEQYEAYFKTEDWTRAETDYLVDLVNEYTMRWIMVGDRYIPTDIPGDVQYPERSLEALKQRYYTVAAKIKEIGTPPSNMTASEFRDWEIMRNFDIKNEVTRRNNAEKLFERTKEEAEEEKILLEELYRLTKHEEEFIALRTELYSRLESAQPIRRTDRGEEQPTAIYQTSQGLSMLLSSLLAKEKRLRRPNPAEAAQSASSEARRPTQPQYNRRDTVESTNDSPAPTKKGSVSQPQIRTLSPAEEAKFGVSHPTERITSGAQFRHDKINRLVMAKSQVQTSKIQAALGELGIPLRVLMATERVTREYERLVTNIHLLLDARKASEKVSNEIKILEESKRQRLNQPKEGEAPSTDQADPNAMDVDQAKPTETAPAEDKVNEDADGEEDESKVETTGNESTMHVDEDGKSEAEQSDAEGEEDDQEYVKNNESQADDDDENDGEEAEEAEAEEDEDDAEEEDEDEDEDGLNTLGKDDDEEEEDDDDDDEDEEAEVESAGEGEQAEDQDSPENDEENGDESDADGADQSDAEGEAEAEEEEAAEDEPEPEEPEPEEPAEPSRPASSHSQARSHKRSASVLSEASKAGSNRSATGRKRRR